MKSPTKQKQHRRTVSTFLLLVACLTLPLTARTFTDTGGNKFEATILGATADKVRLSVSPSNKVYNIPISQLSKPDQKFIANYKTQSAELKKIIKQPTTKITTRPQVLPEKTTIPTRANIRHYTANELKTKFKITENYAKSWPTTTSTPINVPVSIVSETKSRYIYQSPNYEFICDVKLSTTIVQKFALLFEATHELCRQLPISSIIAQVPGSKKRNTIFLFESTIDYHRSGGPVGSAGVFIPKTNQIKIPLESLGIKKLSGTLNYDYSKTNRTITHEIAHQLSDNEFFSHAAMGWFSEGIAEYCAVTPYLSGRYTLRLNTHHVRNYVTAYGSDNKRGRALGKEFKAPDLKRFMLQSYQSFSANGNYNYGLGLLVTHYFIHMEDNRNNLTNFLKALKQGKTGETALLHLLNGRTFDQLEKDIQKAWKVAGVTILFQ